MSFIITTNTNSNTSPDPAQGGNAVTGPANTGHDVTNTFAAFNGNVTKSCKWSGFLNPTNPGIKTQVQLKLEYTEDGSINAPGASTFRLQYSIDGGSNWITIFTHVDVTSPSGTLTETVILDRTQDLTLVQVRDRMTAAGNGDPGGSASLDTSISNIRIETTFFSPAFLD